MNPNLLDYYSNIPLKSIIELIEGLQSKVMQLEQEISDLQSEHRIYERIN